MTRADRALGPERRREARVLRFRAFNVVDDFTQEAVNSIYVVESFNGKSRDERLSMNWFIDPVEARRRIEVWQRDFNEYRPAQLAPESPPSEFAAE